MSQISEAEVLKKPARLIALLSSGESVSIVSGDGHLIGFTTPQRHVAGIRQSRTTKPNMKAWAAEVQARLSKRFGNRVVADSTPMLNESREDRR